MRVCSGLSATRDTQTGSPGPMLAVVSSTTLGKKSFNVVRGFFAASAAFAVSLALRLQEFDMVYDCDCEQKAIYRIDIRLIVARSGILIVDITYQQSET